MTLDEALKRIEELEAKVRELEARPSPWLVSTKPTFTNVAASPLTITVTHV